MASPRGYTSFKDFEREEIRPDMRIGWSCDDEFEATGDDLDFDPDPFEKKMQEAEAEEDED
ncbi:MAG TPA: transcriptional regulator [Polyangiaceae bacterium]